MTLTGQLDLLDAPMTHGRARATDPQTSLEAARSRRDGVERAILNLFTPGRTFTPDEVSYCLEPLGFRDGTVRTAMSRLRGVLVEVPGERRKTRAGCWAQAWRRA